MHQVVLATLCLNDAVLALYKPQRKKSGYSGSNAKLLTQMQYSNFLHLI